MKFRVELLLSGVRDLWTNAIDPETKDDLVVEYDSLQDALKAAELPTISIPGLSIKGIKIEEITPKDST